MGCFGRPAGGRAGRAAAGAARRLALSVLVTAGACGLLAGSAPPALHSDTGGGADGGSGSGAPTSQTGGDGGPPSAGEALGHLVKRDYGGLHPTSDIAGRTQRWKPELPTGAGRFTWAELEPSDGNYDFSAIDRLLGKLDEDQTLRLHISGGDDTPGWLRDKAGALRMRHQHSGTTYTLPRYWTGAFQAEYQDLVQALGNRYDANPRVVSINMFGASTKFDEPFVLGGGDASARRAHEAGLNDRTMRESIVTMTDMTVAAFPHTLVDLSAHIGWQQPTAGGMNQGNWADERALLNRLTTKYGRHLLVSFHGWGPSRLVPAQPMARASSLPAYLRGRARAGYPVGLQMGLNSSADGEITPQLRRRAITSAVKLGASWLEHTGYGYFLDNPAVQRLDRKLRANARDTQGFLPIPTPGDLPCPFRSQPRASGGLCLPPRPVPSLPRGPAGAP